MYLVEWRMRNGGAREVVADLHFHGAKKRRRRRTASTRTGDS